VYEQGPLTRTEAEKLARTMNIEDEDRGNSMYVAERLSEDGTAMLDFMIRAMILVSATIVVLKSDEDFVKFIFSMLAVGVIISLIRQKE
jgi:hypothetical protein